MRLPHVFAFALSLALLPSCLAEIGEPDSLDGDQTEALDRKRPPAPPTVKICHIPPNDPISAQTLEVAQSVVAAHLAHGDSMGPCVCPPGEVWDCYSAPLDTDGIGTCQRGSKTCAADGQSYGPCIGEIVPAPEVCGDGLDNDCDHDVDDGCSACVPQPEACGNGVDDDCDGQVDEGCVCAPGSAASCYGGPAGTAGVGTCTAGSQICNADGSGYGACAGDVTPVADVCGDGLDNDCDGTTDEDCVCAPGSAASCYGGPPGTNGVGTCAAGTQICNADGSGYGACAGEVTPVADVCGDGLDNDCDGNADEGCVCAPGTPAACYTGPAGTNGVGVCRAGTQTCNADGSAYGTCTGSITPTPEVCGDNLDNDCDGQTDEGCLGDRAWNDVNRNGLQDAGEPGLAGATYLLRTASGALVGVAISDTNGRYYFSNVPAGTYYIEVIAPFLFTPTTADVGTDDTIDNDFDGESAATVIFTYSGSADSTWDAGFYAVIQT